MFFFGRELLEKELGIKDGDEMVMALHDFTLHLWEEYVRESYIISSLILLICDNITKI